MSTEQQEILEGNKLIAEFMGAIKDDNTEYYYKGIGMLGGFDYNFQYHSSFDWLMPVVEKIDSFMGIETVCKGAYFYINIYGKKKFSCHTISKINSTYKAIIEFIKWYNDQPKSV